MHFNSRARLSSKKIKNSLFPKSLASLPSLLKKRALSKRVQSIKTEVAARTLYVVDGDDIVITSLDRKPFCCQDELSCMCRAELYRVASELNKKLPVVLRIEPLKAMPTAVIRRRIEEMMGFRHLHQRPPYVPYTPPSPPPFQESPSMVELGALLSYKAQRGPRSPTSSFSSRSSRSSVPSSLYVVKELDESIPFLLKG
ncbi:hypothetical protein M422DRAFT_33673 [Sphaerobolus stellatus SS14]|uniref:Unplaced genomic scaffold SPHSTscaffold_93, whole genome shotgun sequence n=1 Tax=Sphaerobolus stellatus (strain SS14) TaxID=990650 RepID=A0A0C9V7N4_SPHS4|nr:hypothetical protein M422DRAFT_33673 [Sphaerobolus stellatus SS14]